MANGAFSRRNRSNCGGSFRNCERRPAPPLLRTRFLRRRDRPDPRPNRALLETFCETPRFEGAAFRASLAPQPRCKRQNPQLPRNAARGSREPCQLAACAVARLSRTGANATQARRLDPFSYGLAASAGYRHAISFEWIRARQARRTDTFRGVRVTDDLSARQGATHQNRPGFIAEVFGLVRPLCNEGSEIQPRRHHIFVEVEHGKTIRRIPAPALPSRETRIEWIRPGRVGDTPPHMAVRKCLTQ